MEFIVGVGLMGLGLYFGIEEGRATLSGVLTGLGVLMFGGGLFRRHANRKKPGA
jgi:hypothetical protein